LSNAVSRGQKLTPVSDTGVKPGAARIAHFTAGVQSAVSDVTPVMARRSGARSRASARAESALQQRYCAGIFPGGKLGEITRSAAGGAWQPGGWLRDKLGVS